MKDPQFDIELWMLQPGDPETRLLYCIEEISYFVSWGKRLGWRVHKEPSINLINVDL